MEAVGPEDSAAPEAEPSLVFRFVVFADPHVTAKGSVNHERLERAVDRVIAEREARNLRQVLVVGDMAWDAGLAPARAALDRLPVPCVPINGDNEVQLGSEQAYAEAFADHYARLAGELDGFTLAPVEVWNPEVETTSWFHNPAFDYEGLRFLGLDGAARVIDPLYGERGWFHDFEGGTWPVFAEAVAAAAAGPAERVVRFSHIPMHPSPGGFDLAGMERIAALTAPLGDRVWADLGGHYQANGEGTAEGTGYDVIVTDALWDDLVQVRVVEVWSDGSGFRFVTETVDVDG